MERREYLRRAEELAEAGKEEEAIALLKECREVYPDFLVARLYLAKLLHNRGEEDEALKEVEFVLSKNPNTLGALKLQGEILFSKGKYLDAKEVFLKVNFLDPFDEEIARKLQDINDILEDSIRQETIKEEAPFEVLDETPPSLEKEEPFQDEVPLGLSSEPFQKEESQASSHEVEEEKPEQEEEPVFETESMALVLLKQGELERAESIYKKLAAQDPRQKEKLKILHIVKTLSKMKEKLGGLYNV